MNTNKTVTVTLRIASRTLSCLDISRILDWQPTKQFNKGEIVYKRNPARLREEHLWIYDARLEKKTLFEEYLILLVELILKKKDNFKKLRECSIDIFCGYTTYNGQGGFILKSKLMGELASLNIDFIIEFYDLCKIGTVK